MLQTISGWSSTPSALMPHGFCLLWEPWLLWSFVIGDSGTALAYFAIPIALARFVQRRTDLAFKPVFWLFAAFILLCGVTHWLELITIWYPMYEIEAWFKLMTAAVSVATAVAVWMLLPKALAVPSPAQMRAANAAFETSQAELRSLNVSLEARVAERTEELQVKEARLNDLLLTLDLAGSIITTVDGIVTFWSEGCTRVYGWSRSEAVGQNLHQLLQTRFPIPRPDIYALLEHQESWFGDVRQKTREGHEVIVTVRKVLRRDSLGTPVAILEAVTDVTEARRAERERHRADMLLRGIVAAAPGLIYAKDDLGRMLVANDSVMALLGKPWADLQGRTDLEFLDDKAQAELVVANDRTVMQSGQSLIIEELVGMEDGQPRVWLSTKTPLRGPTDEIEGLVGVSVEITERKRTEERLRLMVFELNHRVKNTLATIQSIAAQTFRDSDAGKRETFDSRLKALANAHDVLTRESWQGADLDDVVSVALAPYGGRDSSRFQVQGPPVRLVPRAALAFAMGFHELLTNAMKYGSLSSPGTDGSIDLRWSTKDDRLMLTWTERGGPAVAPPSRRGFGTRMIERSLSQDIGGTVTIHFDAGGLRCEMDTALHEIAATPEPYALPMVGA